MKRGLVGRSPDDLTIEERHAYAGRWVALEIYTPQTIPLRVIEASGDSPADCAQALTARGLDPVKFEFVPVRPAY